MVIIPKKVHSTTKTTIIIVLIIAVIGTVLFFGSQTQNSSKMLAKLVEETGTYNAVYEYAASQNDVPFRVETTYDQKNTYVKNRLPVFETHFVGIYYSLNDESPTYCMGFLGNETWECNPARKNIQYHLGDIETTMRVKRVELLGGEINKTESKTILNIETKCYIQTLGDEKAKYCFDKEGNPLYFSYEKPVEHHMETISYQAIEYSPEVPPTEKFEAPTGPVR